VATTVRKFPLVSTVEPTEKTPPLTAAQTIPPLVYAPSMYHYWLLTLLVYGQILDGNQHLKSKMR
jgi:hypothetical protein